MSFAGSKYATNLGDKHCAFFLRNRFFTFFGSKIRIKVFQLLCSDDWELNGDIIVYYPVLDIGLELSSMGIRVDEDSLKAQLKEAGCEDRAELPFQKALLNGELPYTVGGGIGQSRICMYYLRKAHIGEVQSSLWPENVVEAAADAGIHLL